MSRKAHRTGTFRAGYELVRTIGEVRNDRVRLACGHFIYAPGNTLALEGGARVGNGIECRECAARDRLTST